MLHNVDFCGLLWLAVACCAVACCHVLYCVVLSLPCCALLCCAVQTRPALHCRRGTVMATGGADKVVKLWDPSGVNTGTLQVSAML